MKRVYSLLLSAILLAGTTWVAAQEYPSKPVRLIVPFAPGGGNDIVARAIAQQLSASLGRQFVVDNRAGAGGVVGAELAAKSPSNGNGSSAQLAAVLYASMAGVRMVHVPYKGLAPALADLLSGEVQLMFSSMVAIIPHIKTGRLRALA